MKKYISLLFVILLMFTITGCKDNSEKILLDDESNEKRNNELFYKNSNDIPGADPFILYEENEDEHGAFYCYLTSGDLGAKGFNVYRSSDLRKWANAGVAFMAEGSMWGSGKYWAPEVIKDEDGIYYMFYSAQWGDMNYGLYISVATSKEPAGPFKEYSDESKKVNEPLIQFEKHLNEIPKEYRSSLVGKNGDTGFIKVIDASPFIDPVTGDKYLYFIADIGTDYTEGSFVFGMQMQDWTTPMYETLTRLTRYEYYDVSGEEKILEGGKTNEGCSVYYHDGKYYLTFSTFTYTTSEYQVRQAISDAPLGNFVKVDPQAGGSVIQSEAEGISQSAGHSSFFEIDDELWLSYHTFANDMNIDDGRKAYIDKIVFVENQDGDIVMRANGPTTTYQPLPKKISGYLNLMEKATIECDNGTENSSTNYLNDGYIPLNQYTPVSAYYLKPGQSSIKISFNEYKTVSSILVYNYLKESKRFGSIKNIIFEGKEETYELKDIVYDASATLLNGRKALDYALIQNISDLEVISITLTFDEDHIVGIPEIIVLGK